MDSLSYLYSEHWKVRLKIDSCFYKSWTLHIHLYFEVLVFTLISRLLIGNATISKKSLMFQIFVPVHLKCQITTSYHSFEYFSSLGYDAWYMQISLADYIPIIFCLGKIINYLIIFDIKWPKVTLLT